MAMLFTSCAGPAPGRHVIAIEQLEYHPGELEIAEGDTVIWYNRDIVPHTVTLSEDDERGDTVASGDSIAIVVQQTGARRYHCRFHPTMTGVLNIR
jgi:plastocyanin